MGSQVDDFLNQKMDRKEFLKNVGAGLTAMVGLGVIARAFQQPQQQAVQQSGNNAMGYGSSSYGGTKQVSAQPSVPTRKVI